MVKKLLAVLLAAMMLAGILVGCGNSTVTDDNTAASTTVAALDTTPETESPYDANGYLKDSIPEDTNFGGETINILFWSDVERPEFEVEEQTGDLVKDAIFTRNMKVEERLGVTLNWIGTKGNYSNLGNFLTAIENDFKGSSEYEIYAGYSIYAASATTRGFNRDLNKVTGLDFDKPWWPATFLDTVTMHNKIYFCTGDISTNTLYMMYCTWFTKELAQEYKLTDLYDLGKNGQWTIDKMMEYASGAYVDLNGNTKKDYASDQFGFMTANLHFDGFFNGSGLLSVEKDEEGRLIAGENFGSEKTQDLIVKLVTYFEQDYCDVTATGDTNVDVTALSQGRCLFNVNRCYIPTWNVMQDPMGTYGILPFPKYDADQPDYISCMANPHTQYALSAGMDEETANRVSVVLECMASEAYRNTSPALFELTMKLKYATGQEDSEMYDIIRRTVTIDLGRIFYDELSGMSESLFRNAVRDKATAWTTQFKANSKVLNKKLDAINETLDALE